MSESYGTLTRPPTENSSNSRDEFTLRIPRPHRSGGNGGHRAATKTTEFYMTLLLAFGVLLATYLDEDTLNRVDGWRFATFAVMAYVISRGIAKLGNRNDASHDHNSENNVDVR